MIFTAASELIQASLEMIGVQDPAEVMEAGPAATGLRTLNLLLDALSIDRGKIYIRTENIKVLTIGTEKYTIGAAGDIPTVTPITIEQAYLRETTLSIDYPLRVTMTQAERNALPLKNIQTIPENLYFTGGTDPGTIYFDYLPDKAYELHLFSVKPFTKLTAITDALSVPDGYEAFITAALGVWLCLPFSVPIPQTLAAIAKQIENMIDSKNLELPPTWEDKSQPGTMNWSRSSDSGNRRNIYTL